MYQKPLILKCADLMEGVYAYSGDLTEEELQEFITDEPIVEDTSVSYSIDSANYYPGGCNYTFTVVNYSAEKADSVVFTVRISGTIQSLGGNGSAVINGDTADIYFDNYGNGLEPETSYSFWMQAVGDGEFRIE